MIYRFLLLMALEAVTAAYFLAPDLDKSLGWAEPRSGRILFFHAPEAMLCTLFFLWGAVMAFRYFRTKDLGYDIRSLAAIEVGVLLCFLATVTGMVFAQQQWGVAWNWDARQTSILIQLLIYLGYFSLRTGFSSRERSAANAAAYAIFAFLTVPFLIWILPRLPQIQSQHKGANQAVIGNELDTVYRVIFYSCVIVIGLVSAWLYKLRVQEAELRRMSEEIYELEAGDSYPAAARVVRPVRLRDTD